MKNTKGFTLIELLVVVLIIGILAAIALPQYTKTVEKSRASEALINLKAISDAAQRYYLLNNSSYSDITTDNLDIEPVTKSNMFDYAFGDCNAASCTVTAKRNNDKYTITYYLASGGFDTSKGTNNTSRECADAEGSTVCSSITPMFK